MKNNTFLSIGTIIVFVLVSLSGCLEFFSNLPTTYEAHPTHVAYDISYGYRVTCSGTGGYEIDYLCDIPDQIFNGMVSYEPLYQHEYEAVSFVNNSFIQWNVSGNRVTTYELGIMAHAQIESFLVSDLTGKQALTVEQIQSYYPDLVAKYTQKQSNDTTPLITPDDPTIVETAEAIRNQANTTNSFLLAKALFTWLKENIQYQIHKGQGNVQPATVTCEKKTGDCDDLSFLYISLCRALQLPARFIRGYLLSEDFNGKMMATAHAWTEVFVGGDIGNQGWIPVECACCTSSIEIDINQNFGVENAFHFRLFVDDGSDESLIAALSGIAYKFSGQKRTIEIESFSEVTNYLELEAQQLVVTSDDIRSYE